MLAIALDLATLLRLCLPVTSFREDAMFARLFVDHPRTVGESYFEHMGASLRIAARLGMAAGKCVVHAVVPGMCKTAGSDAIVKLHGEVAPRRYDQPTF